MEITFKMVFDRSSNTITIYADGRFIGTYAAENFTVNQSGDPNQPGSDGPAPNSVYHVSQIDKDAYYTKDNAQSHGTQGVFHLSGPGNSSTAQLRGLLIHAGRDAAFARGMSDQFSGAWTEGCIRVGESTITLLESILNTSSVYNTLIVK